MNTWDRIKNQISSKISTDAFNNWLSRSVFLKSEGDRLWVAVPDTATRDWIQQEYSAEIWSAVRDLSLSLREIVYEIQGSVQTTGGRGFDDKNEICILTVHHSEPEIHVRQLCGGRVQPVCPCRRAVGR